MEDKVKNLQDNLKYLRMAAGMTQAELGKELGVTRQMVNNLENKHNNMTLMQYHAILHVFQDVCELDNERCSNLLSTVYHTLVRGHGIPKYKEYVRKGVLIYMPAYFNHVACMEEITEYFDNYLLRYSA
jgi:DNA-binding XRE family transcriptional regulator